MGVKLMTWARNGTPDTLTVAGDELLISDLTPTTFNVTLSHSLHTGDNSIFSRSGNASIDTGTNYSNRSELNGGTDTTVTSQDDIAVGATLVGDSDIFSFSYFINISTEEKLYIFQTVASNTDGAGNVPNRISTVAKWVNTTDQADNFNIINQTTGSYDIDSNLSVLGTD